ncbi:MAG: TRAP transporter small permease [Bosea sp. (in: a-proteobacteria)]
MSGFLYRPTLPEPAPLRVLGDLIDIILVGLATALIVIMFTNVLARGILNVDIAWNTEFGEFCLVWATFIGAAAAARRGAHMRISELVEAAHPRLRRVLEVATRTGVLLLLGLLVWRGMLIVDRNMDQQMSVLYWPVGLQYLAMPAGSALTAIYVAYDLSLLVRGEAAIETAME